MGQDEETNSDRIYRYARIDLTAALEDLANHTGLPLPPKRLFTKEDYIRRLTLLLFQQRGPHALAAASTKAAADTRKLFPGGEDIIAMCHAHFLRDFIR